MTLFTVVNHDTLTTRVEDSRAAAEDRAEKAQAEFGFNPDDLEVVKGGYEEYENVVTDTPDVVDAETVAPKEDTPDTEALDELGESLETDPLSILPGHMVDSIQGQPAVNKRGYAMIAERYGIEASADVVQLPWENEEGRCVAKATAITDDGKEYSGWATACADDGDMADQLIELAETRALKRSVAWASGAGIVGYQELSNQLEQ